jgi:hypothetical protein
MRVPFLFLPALLVVARLGLASPLFLYRAVNKRVVRVSVRR